MNRKALAMSAVAALVLGGGAWWWHEHALRRQDDGTIRLQGNVDIRQVSLAFDANGRIASLAVAEGDRVKAGQVLGTLDIATARVRLAQAAAQAAASEQALARLRAGSRPEERARARADVAGAQADATLAHEQLLRLQRVRDATAGKGVGRQDLDDAVARDQVAAARLEAAVQGARIVATGPRKEDIAQAAAQLDAARAQRDLVGRDLAESELRAPVDAVVRARLLEPGDMASPQRPVYTLAIVQPKWVRAWLAEAELARVRPGMPAEVRTDGDPGHPIGGRVGTIASVAEFTPKSVETAELRTSLVYEVRILVDDPQDRLRLGMPATVVLRPAATAAP